MKLPRTGPRQGEIPHEITTFNNHTKSEQTKVVPRKPGSSAANQAGGKKSAGGNDSGKK